MIFEAFEIAKLYIVISDFGKLRGVIKNVAGNVKYFYVKYYENKINIYKKKNIQFNLISAIPMNLILAWPNLSLGWPD